MKKSLELSKVFGLQQYNKRKTNMESFGSVSRKWDTEILAGSAKIDGNWERGHKRMTYLTHLRQATSTHNNL